MKRPSARWLLKNRPIESNYTAAWAGCDDYKAGSKVPIPKEEDVIEAKKWVEENQK